MNASIRHIFTGTRKIINPIIYSHVVVWLIISDAKILVATMQSIAFTRSQWKKMECTRYCRARCSFSGDEEYYRKGSDALTCCGFILSSDLVDVYRCASGHQNKVVLC